MNDDKLLALLYTIVTSMENLNGAPYHLSGAAITARAQLTALTVKETKPLPFGTGSVDA